MIPNWKKIALGNEKLKQNFIFRSKIKNLTRDFFINQGFLEFDFPSLIKSPAQELHIDLPKVYFSSSDEKNYQGFLASSPELQIKKFVSAGFDKIFTFAKTFRDKDPWNKSHNPEFTMLEWYRGKKSWKEVVEDSVNLLRFIAKNLFGEEKIEYLGKLFDISGRWKIYSIPKFFYEKHGKSADEIMFEGRVFYDFLKKNFNLQFKSFNLNELFSFWVLEDLEKEIGQNPAIVCHFPVFEGALAKKSNENPNFCERAEVYFFGFEIANAYTELNNKKEMEKRFLEVKEKRKKLGKDEFPMDYDFLDSLDFFPESGGIGLGFDRIVQIFTNSESIEEVLTFPAKEIFC